MLIVKKLIGTSIVLALLACNVLTAQTTQVKFGKGVSILAPDSSLYLKMGFRFQSLFATEGDLNSDSDWESSFLVRRSRLKFDGWAVNPNLVYKVELALSNSDLKSSRDWEQSGEAPKIILDAVLKWKFHKNFTLWAGQTKLPGNRERVVSSQKLQLVDRSQVNSIFNLDRDMGVQLHSKFNVGHAVIKPIVAISLGEGRNITSGNIGGYNYTGRLEFLPNGEFASKGDYFQADLKREPTPKVAFGATLDINKGASRQTQTGRFLIDSDGNYLQNDLQTVLLDAVFKYQGFSMFAEYAERKCLLSKGVSHDDVMEEMLDASGRSYYTGNGIAVQAGYLFKNNWEIASRFTRVTPDWDKSFKANDEYTLGLSKYIVGHSLKVQSDISLIDQTDSNKQSLRYRLQFEFAF
jgi:hypothetical protein